MPRILVVYGTTEGHTAKVAGAIAETLHRIGAVVDVTAADEGAPAPAGYDAVIVAASVHAGRYQQSVETWVRDHAAVLSRKPAAFVSVCLSVLQKDSTVQQDLQAILDRFIATTGWRPAVAKFVAGALPYTRYGWVRHDLSHFAADFGQGLHEFRP